MNDHNQDTVQTLLTIQSTAKNLLEIIQKRLPKETTKYAVPANIAIPILDLPFPNDLDATLRNLGLDGFSHIHRKIQDWVGNLRNIHSINFQRACRELASLPHYQSPRSLASAIEHVRLAYQKTYANYLPSITAHILSAKSKQSSICKNSKIPFNNEYTPILELYFEQNAYPSLADRKLLARKSMMTMRQIEVWFQNHRARARKEGRVIEKHSRQCHSQLIFDESVPFVSATNPTMIPSIDDESRYEASEDETSTTPPSFAPCLFSQVAPPHAFPTIYPPKLPTDPFPKENGKFLFPPPIWMRTPAEIRSQTDVLDMDEFISMFSSKLHLRAGSRRKCDTPQARSIKEHRNPLLAPMVVVPSPAPHPALIRAPYIHSASGLITPPSFAPGSYPPTNPSCPPPPSPFPNPYKPRKFAPFSKRAPSALSTNHTPPKHPKGFSAFASRSCSFSSAASPQSRSSSLSSVSSVEPATPPLSPTQKVQSPLFADHDYQLLDELFGPEPSQLFDNNSYGTHDFLFPTLPLKDASHNALYDLSSMFPPAISQIHC
ncbi:hypothetical protein M413DRAFT_439432 [Hebeloma cylindrosporum]|uniref:Homeobox domain-containing protein n=1 Tax=Hebeloma cylindrosporum TaxID=76867 RepID=A0A0C2Z3D8_HEBCY|nr:hypothetical protein M413DRAFT_439432 [Hebeloma cylindrosporum h7]